MIVVYGFRQCRVHCVSTATDPLAGRSRRQLRLRLGAFHTRVDSCALRLPSSRVHDSLLDDLVQVSGQQVLLRLAVLRDRVRVCYPAADRSHGIAGIGPLTMKQTWSSSSMFSAALSLTGPPPGPPVIALLRSRAMSGAPKRGSLSFTPMMFSPCSRATVISS